MVSELIESNNERISDFSKDARSYGSLPRRRVRYRRVRGKRNFNFSARWWSSDSE
jgi:hypothetical protein